MVALGGVSVCAKKLRWKELRRRAHVAEEAAPHVTDTSESEPART